MRRRVNRLMGGGRIVLFDSFTDADGVEPQEHASESGVRWRACNHDTNTISGPPGTRATVNANRLLARADVAGTSLMFADRHKKRRSMSVAADITRVAGVNNSLQNIGVALRMTDTMWLQATHHPNANVWQVNRRLPSTGTVQLGSNVAQTLTQGQVYRLRADARGSRVLVWVDDVLIINVEDAAIARGKPGFRIGNTTVVMPMVLDNWMTTR